MKKLIITFLLGFIACMYWVYSNPKTREKLTEAFKGCCSDEKLKEVLDKVKQKNTDLKNKFQKTPSESILDDTMNA